MNVIRFDIEVTFVPTVTERITGFCQKRFWTKLIKFKPPVRPSIKTFISSKFKESSDNIVNYEVVTQSKWNALRNGKIKALCSAQSIVGALRTEKIDCFVFHPENFSIKDKITLEVVVLSEMKNISHSVAVVFKEIERQLSAECSVKALVENHVFLFPFNHGDNDIWNADYRIKANFSSFILTTMEKWRTGIVASIMFVVFVLLLFGTFSETAVGRLSGIAISCALFLLTDFLPRFVHGKTLSVTVNDLSTVVDDPPVLPYGDGGTPKLNNPTVPK